MTGGTEISSAKVLCLQIVDGWFWKMEALILNKFVGFVISEPLPQPHW